MRNVLLAALIFAATSPSGAAPAAPEGRLRLFHTHTLERIDVVYRRDGAYLPEALARLNHFLRDHRTNAVRHYDPRLYDLLSDLETEVRRPNAELHVICGYRTPKTNSRLRRRSAAVAGNSLHMRAEAIDIRLPGVRTARLRDTALTLGRGGVGYYRRSDFVHVDVGRVRRW